RPEVGPAPRDEDDEPEHPPSLSWRSGPPTRPGDAHSEADPHRDREFAGRDEPDEHGIGTYVDEPARSRGAGGGRGEHAEHEPADHAAADRDPRADERRDAVAERPRERRPHRDPGEETGDDGDEHAREPERRVAR